MARLDPKTGRWVARSGRTYASSAAARKADGRRRKPRAADARTRLKKKRNMRDKRRWTSSALRRRSRWRNKLSGFVNGASTPLRGRRSAASPMAERSRIVNSQRTMFARSVNRRAIVNLMLGANSVAGGYVTQRIGGYGVFVVPVTAHDDAVACQSAAHIAGYAPP